MKTFFQSRVIAVVGASDTSDRLGYHVFRNLLSAPFEGQLYPVNLRRNEVMGHRAYARLADLPKRPDLVLIATPVRTLTDVVKEAGEAGVGGVVIHTSTPRNAGGHAIEQELLALARQYQFRLLGPGSLGLMLPHRQFQASSLRQVAHAGQIAFITQSGAMGEAILDQSFREKVGFSAFIGLGAMLDVGWSDLLSYLGDDGRTKALLLYLEEVDDARRFISAAREVSFTKPIIVIKPGRMGSVHQVQRRLSGVTISHDDVFDAVFRRCGVLRVDTIGDLFYMASVLDKQPPALGNRLAIVTNASGPALLAADALLRGGGQMAKLSKTTEEKMSPWLTASRKPTQNPVDLGEQATPELYRDVLRALVEDTENDGVLVVLTPQAGNDPAQVAELLSTLKELQQKPILTSFMGDQQVRAANERLNQAGIPTLLYPDSGARVFNYMWRYRYNLRGIYQTPRVPEAFEKLPPDRQRVEAIFRGAQRRQRTLLTELESKFIMDCYRLPVVDTRYAASEQEALTQAESIGYPVVLKVNSDMITHKRAAGGVYLNLNEPMAVRHAFRAIREKATQHFGPEAFQGVTVQQMFHHTGLEVYLGSQVDPFFGPVIVFGNGGRIIELYNDKAIALPPLNTTLARRAMEQTRIYEASQQLYNKSEELVEGLAQLLVQFSQLLVDHPQIQEIDLNPIAVSARGIQVLDARVLLRDAADASPAVPLAIRPYPLQYERPFEMHDGQRILIRPIRAEDEPAIVAFHQTLSDDSVYMRFFYKFSYQQRVSHERLARICFADYEREITLVAQLPGADGKIVGAVQLMRQRHGAEAEFAMLISDTHQRQGLGRRLLEMILDVARQEGVAVVTAEILPANQGMQKICRHLGFRLRSSLEDGVVYARKDFAAQPSPVV